LGERDGGLLADFRRRVWGKTGRIDCIVAAMGDFPVQRKPKENFKRGSLSRRAAQRDYTMFSFVPRKVCPGDILLTRVPFKLLDINT
jgi:hypothetical protein